MYRVVEEGTELYMGLQICIGCKELYRGEQGCIGVYRFV